LPALRRRPGRANSRGEGRRAAAAFRRALRAHPTGNDGWMSLIGLGVARFILGDYGRRPARWASSPPARGRIAS
jgi:hypothetical protein